MIEPLELQVFPSCYNCISWSEDGELAVATGEYVQVLTPKTQSKREADGTASQFLSTDWHRSRFRANVFTINEWSIMFPQPRDRFSVGAELSMSTVVGVAWSSPGLARYRRSVLAVLTSNMVLSIYAIAGTQRKWTRIAVVNKALERFFQEDVGNDTPRSAKSNIRAFAWTPPLKVPTDDPLHCGFESRWGIMLLTVTNDDNDVVFLKVQLPAAVQEAPSEILHVDVVATVPLSDPVGFDHIIQPTSVFASAIRPQVQTLSLSSGPWVFQSPRNDMNGIGRFSAVLNVAGVQGRKLRVVRFNIDLEPRTEISDEESGYNLSFYAIENTAVLTQRMEYLHLTGPIDWARKTGSSRMYIAVGCVAGLALIDLSELSYTGQVPESDDIVSQYCPTVGATVYSKEQTKMELYERISGMTVAFEPESETPILHFGTVGGYSAFKLLQGAGEVHASTQALWIDQIEDMRERFDIDRDLGGLAISRVWGLASTQGLLAAAVTLHPGDMVEYRTNAEERVIIVFSTANGQTPNPEYVPFLRGPPTKSVEFIREHRDIVLKYIFGTANDTGAKKTLSSKVLYAAACSAIVQSESDELLSSAREVLEKLAQTSGIDVSDEIAKCSSPGNVIDAKTAEELNAPGGDMFETCEVCEAGLSWYSAQEAQCADGHIFVRCSLTSMAIQEPGLSKFCSKCDSEYLDEDLMRLSSAGDIQQACRILSDVFDTCIYCDGKFRS
ncbi:transcription factor IIIC subunit delta N-term-domain-containing protein [Aspergillus californicus]